MDSSVAALLLQRDGYEVVGLKFSLEKKEEDNSDVLSVADKLGIELKFADFSDTFEKEVLKPFVDSYASGKTPNICVSCNKKIKFGKMFELAQELDCEFVATGHYASIIDLYGHFCLAKAQDESKDQTYFLHSLTEEKLAKIIFPLSKLTKPEVRAIAEKEGLITAHKKGSSDICIMGDKSFPEFIGGYLSENAGDIVDEKGNVVGRHKGLFNYTLGQRKGLNLGGRAGEEGRWFIVKKDAALNRIVVSHGDESPLFTKTVVVKNFNFINGAPEKEEFPCFAKTRYRQKATEAKCRLSGDKVIVEFVEPVRAATSGQFCVLYNDLICLGGGEIE